SGAKKRWMRSNSPRGRAATAGLQIAGAQHMRDAVEHAVDQARLLAREERVGDVEILADDDTRWHVGPRQQLIGAGAQHGAQDRLEPIERPVGGERARQRAVEIRLAHDSAVDDIGEESRISLAVILAVLLAVEAMLLEFGDHRGRRRAAQIDLIERLDGSEARYAAPAECRGRARRRHVAAHRPFSPKWRFSSIMARQALAASPPLFLRSTRARASACASFSTVRMPKPMARLCSSARSCRPRALSPQT